MNVFFYCKLSDSLLIILIYYYGGGGSFQWLTWGQETANILKSTTFASVFLQPATLLYCSLYRLNYFTTDFSFLRSFHNVLLRPVPQYFWTLYSSYFATLRQVIFLILVFVQLLFLCYSYYFI